MAGHSASPPGYLGSGCQSLARTLGFRCAGSIASAADFLKVWTYQNGFHSLQLLKSYVNLNRQDQNKALQYYLLGFLVQANQRLQMH